MIGQKFNRVTIVSDSGIRKNQKRYWNCLCDCGAEFITYTSALTTGNTKSCGCFRGETQRASGRGSTHKHSIGGKPTITYFSWRAMKQRCYCPKNKDYHSYGGKGIKVDGEWRDSFIQFLSDMGERPSKDYSLDRIDPDWDYCKENCQWILKAENSRKAAAQRKLRAERREREVVSANRG